MFVQLEFQDDRSHKFWEIRVEGDAHVVRYGRVGTQGQTKTKTFASNELATKAAEKLVESKRKKGYVD
ncbi:MAG: WGR domain-containing protein, partial [Polyangiaceae bacterium]|nr:WGR domain-containing protein [Polyangiaceae bacterium]